MTKPKAHKPGGGNHDATELLSKHPDTPSARRMSLAGAAWPLDASGGCGAGGGGGGGGGGAADWPDLAGLTDPVELELQLAALPSGWRLSSSQTRLRAARRELRWFHAEMRGRVPAAGHVPREAGAAASRIAGWLAELLPSHRGAFVVRYDGRRWPVRLVRMFGGLTSIVVRFAAMRRARGPAETVFDAERAAALELMEDVAAGRRPIDYRVPAVVATPLAAPLAAMEPAAKLRRLRRAARAYLRRAEQAYLDARGHGPCVVPARSREGA